MKFVSMLWILCALPALLVVSPDPAVAGEALDVEIEVLSAESEASPLKGQIELGANYSSGNSRRKGLNFGAQGVRETADDLIEGKFSNLYAEEEGSRSVNEQHLSFRYDRKLLPRYVFGLLAFERDEFENLTLRADLSPGVGYVLADGEEFKAKAEVGPSVLYQDYEDVDAEWELELRVGFYAEAKVFDQARITEELQIHPSLSESGDYRVTSETAFEQPLSEELFFKLSVLWYTNSEVPEGVDRHDLKVLASLVLKF